MFDDLGYGDLGCYGQEMIETPNIDALAERGIRFTDMYTACPLSAPSRCSIMTGKHTGHSQIRHNEEANARLDDPEALYARMLADSTFEGQWPLAPDTPTIARMMKEAGYRTAMVGKWGLGNPGSGSMPCDMGFDYFYGFVCQLLAHSYYPDLLWENDHRVPTGNLYMPVTRRLDPGADPYDIRSYDKFNQQYYSPDLMYEKIDRWIGENAGEPFMLMWTTTVPHSTVQAPEDEVMYYVDKLGEEKTPVTDGGWYYPVLYPHSAYAAMVTHIDTQVGKLVARLKELGIYDNTIIIVTSDNGPANNSNSPMEYFKSGGPFKCRKGWGKSSLHEGGIRMPFIVAWGDRLTPARTDYIGPFTDLMPTFAELAGVDAPERNGSPGNAFPPACWRADREPHLPVHGPDADVRGTRRDHGSRERRDLLRSDPSRKEAERGARGAILGVSGREGMVRRPQRRLEGTDPESPVRGCEDGTLQPRGRSAGIP